MKLSKNEVNNRNYYSLDGKAYTGKIEIMYENSKNIKTIGLTGKSGGKMKDLCDITICVPEDETFMIQELHLPIYHALCAMLEADFFTEK